MANRQVIGDKVSLKDGPKNFLPDNHKAGTFQFVGDKVKLPTEACTVKYGASTPQGTLQHVGDSVKLQPVNKPYTGMNNAPGSELTIRNKKDY